MKVLKTLLRESVKINEVACELSYHNFDYSRLLVSATTAQDSLDCGECCINDLCSLQKQDQKRPQEREEYYLHEAFKAAIMLPILFLVLSLIIHDGQNTAVGDPVRGQNGEENDKAGDLEIITRMVLQFLTLPVDKIESFAIKEEIQELLELGNLQGSVHKRILSVYLVPELLCQVLLHQFESCSSEYVTKAAKLRSLPLIVMGNLAGE